MVLLSKKNHRRLDTSIHSCVLLAAGRTANEFGNEALVSKFKNHKPFTTLSHTLSSLPNTLPQLSNTLPSQFNTLLSLSSTLSSLPNTLSGLTNTSPSLSKDKLFQKADHFESVNLKKNGRKLFHKCLTMVSIANLVMVYNVYKEIFP